ncbi:MAG: hypothetical protein AAGI03_05285 [Pseudomonadota bacterium]
MSKDADTPTVGEFVEALRDTELLSEQAFERICGATLLPISSRVSTSAARHELDFLVRQTIRAQFRQKADKSVIDRFTKKGEAFFALLDELNESGLPTPSFSSQFRKDFERWKGITWKSSKSGPAKSTMKVWLVPRVLGIFSVLFEAEPTSTAKLGKNGEPRFGAAALFIQQLIAEVRAKVDTLLQDLDTSTAKRVRAQWLQRTPDAFEELIRFAKALTADVKTKASEARPDPRQDQGQVSDEPVPEWQTHACFYASTLGG